MQAVAFSGGKDSTAMAVMLAEAGEDFVLLFTPTQNEFTEVETHVRGIAARLNRELVVPPNQSLAFWIGHHKALPNWRMRWCTRAIKIQPCIEWLKEHPGTTLCVGLRADEEARTGLYGDYCTYRYPLRDAGMTQADVWDFLAGRCIKIPTRTDCAVCFFQSLPEWWTLWREHPEEWAQGEAWEAQTGHTFRSPGRDSWPAAMKDLRAEFERGNVPRGVELTLPLFEDGPTKCRVCSM